MIIYNVTVKIDLDVHDLWLKWMKEEHIPRVMETACFTDCKCSGAGRKYHGWHYLRVSILRHRHFKILRLQGDITQRVCKRKVWICFPVNIWRSELC